MGALCIKWILELRGGETHVGPEHLGPGVVEEGEETLGGRAAWHPLHSVVV